MSYTQVTVYHGVKEHNFDGYKAGDPVAPVFTYVTHNLLVAGDDPVASRETNDLAVAEHAFHIFNAPAEYLDGQDVITAAAYRANRLRSLSVGDLVAVNDRVYSCERAGFKPAGRRALLNIQPDPYAAEAWTETTAR